MKVGGFIVCTGHLVLLHLLSEVVCGLEQQVKVLEQQFGLLVKQVCGLE